jgi:hypothetical protein
MHISRQEPTKPSSLNSNFAGKYMHILKLLHLKKAIQFFFARKDFLKNVGVNEFFFFFKFWKAFFLWNRKVFGFKSFTFYWRKQD